MVVLTNRNSASASEIVAGALQDHDRAYIVGETTFGKALVQSVYRISAGAGLALTTAHYYTPSGRLIQRPWDASLRRVPQLLDARSGRQQAAQSERSEAHRRRAVPSTAAAASSPIATWPGRSRASTPRRSGGCSTCAARSRTTRVKFTADGDTRSHAAVHRPPQRLAAASWSTMRWCADFREQLKADRLRIDEEAFQKDLAVHQGDDPVPDRRGGVRHRRGRSDICSRSIPRRRRDSPVRRGREAAVAWRGTARVAQ